MPLLKKMILGVSAFILILWGGSGTQSQNLALQGGGFIALIFGLVILYIFGRMVWRAMGCLMSFAIIAGIIAFIVYAVGGFENGVTGMPDKIKTFLGQGQQVVETQSEEVLSEEDMPNLSENMAAVKPRPQPKAQPQPQPRAKAKTKKGFSPLDYQYIIAPARVINGDTLQINGAYLKLYGIDAPEANQTCANRQGRSYACGKQAGAWLRDWIGGYDLKCHIVAKDEKGNMSGVCLLGEYDLGAALVNAGWAVAIPDPDNIYTTYEGQAKQSKRGLWQGEFYKPWDWRALQSKKPKIKVIEAKKSKKEGMFGF